MSTNAPVILEEIKALPPEEQEQVRDGILQLQDRQRQWEEQKLELRRLQASSKGKGLLKALLEDRIRERMREEAWLKTRQPRRDSGVINA
ncbi:MAG TPA: hypothetical protein VNO52_17600 [Methylomirabilota bacterium]|nr:hypothetical protein [Methylomirabilota bacterium]